MAKQSGLGDNFYIGGYDLSGDVSSLDQVSGPLATLDVTPVNSYGTARIPGLRDGDMQFTSFFNAATGAEHPALSVLPRTDVIASYFRGTTLGNASACINGKQVNYDGTRDNTGNLTLKVEVQANAYGLEWGKMLTPGLRTDTVSANQFTGNQSTFESGLGNWVSGSNCTVAQSTAKAHSGTHSMSLTSSASGTMYAASTNAVTTNALAVTPGQEIQVGFWALAAVTSELVTANVNWWDASGNYLTTATAGQANDNTSTWTQVAGVAVAPALTAYATLDPTLQNTLATSEVHYFDDMSMAVVTPPPGVLDNATSTAFGAQAYLQVTALTGTSADIVVQHSADNATWATLIDFGSQSAAGAVRGTATGTVNRYLRAVTGTGTFTSVTFAVTVARNPIAVSF